MAGSLKTRLEGDKRGLQERCCICFRLKISTCLARERKDRFTDRKIEPWGTEVTW